MEAQNNINSVSNKCPEDCMNLGPFLAQYVLSNPFDQTSVSSKPIFAQIISKMQRPKPNILRQGLRPCNTQNKNDKRKQCLPSFKFKDPILEATSIQAYNSNNYLLPANNDLDLEAIMTQSSNEGEQDEIVDHIPEITIKIEPDWDTDSTCSHNNLSCDCHVEIKSEITEEDNIGIIKEISIEKENKVAASEQSNSSRIKAAANTVNKRRKVTKSSMNLRQRNSRKANFSELKEIDKKKIFDTYLSNKSSDNCLKLLINEFRNIKDRIDKLESLIINRPDNKIKN